MKNADVVSDLRLGFFKAADDFLQIRPFTIHQQVSPEELRG
jgi:hypothetical protein